MKRLLLHACCAPCSSAIIEKLAERYDITIYFYNPNIYPETEYETRRNEIIEFYKSFPIENDIKVVVEDGLYSDYIKSIDILHHPEYSQEPEQGKRCNRCYAFRMKKAYEYALNNNFDYFSTTLSISPFKNEKAIHAIGIALEDKVKFLDETFRELFPRSRELSEEHNLYRQQYCGCSFSMKTAVSD